jgi:abhydrolase domain-containing protein 17
MTGGAGVLRRRIFSAVQLYVVLQGCGWLFSERMMFPVPPASYRDDETVFKLSAGPDGALISARFYENPAADMTLLYSHGNGEDIGHCHDHMEYLRSLGFSVLIYEYRGYGTSAGRPSERALYEDINAAWHWLTEFRGIPPERILVYGRSIGSGPSCWLAERNRIGGLIVESGFLSAFRVYTQIPLFPFDRFPNVRRLRGVDCPVLVIHGTRDRVIPFRHGLALYRAAPGMKASLWVEGAGHNDLVLQAGPAYDVALCRFAEKH